MSASVENLSWSEPVKSELQNAGFSVAILEVWDSSLIQSLLHADAIVTTQPALSLQLVQAFAHLARPPLLALIIEAPGADLDIGDLDLVLPPYPTIITHQMLKLLHLQRDRDQLAKQVEEQSALIESLHAHPRPIQHSINGDHGRPSDVQPQTNEVELLMHAIVRNVSHELKTPLLHVKSAVSMLAEDVQNQKLVTYAENAVSRLENLIHNITMLNSSLDIESSPMFIRDALEYARRNLRRIWNRKTELDRIRFDIDEDLQPIMADRQAIGIAVQLLLDNALKFSADEVVVTARRDGEHAYIAVEDHGIGIAPDKLKAIFGTFFQVDSSVTRRYGGVGIGLALVKLILDRHNATIHVESVLNEGSIFYFRLPICSLE